MESILGFGRKQFNFLSDKKQFDASFQIKSTPMPVSLEHFSNTEIFKKCCIDCTPNSSVRVENKILLKRLLAK